MPDMRRRYRFSPSNSLWEDMHQEYMIALYRGYTEREAIHIAEKFARRFLRDFESNGRVDFDYALSVPDKQKNPREIAIEREEKELARKKIQRLYDLPVKALMHTLNISRATAFRKRKEFKQQLEVKGDKRIQSP